MDKQTLSSYGWIVIAVLVLSVMIALATPFGEYVKGATLSTLNGFFDTEEQALNVLGQKAKNYTHKEGEVSVLWTESHSGKTYYFERQSNDNESSDYYVLKSNNKSKNSTTATYIFKINVPEEIEYSFDWSVSSESYDKLTISVNGTKIVNGKGGLYNGTETITLQREKIK